MEVQSGEVSERMQRADEWRRLGDQLHALSPELFERVFAMLVMSIPDGVDKNITESYLLA